MYCSRVSYPWEHHQTLLSRAPGARIFSSIHARPKAARLTPHRTPRASALVSGLRSEDSSPPRSAPAGPQRDAPDTQRRWRTRPPRDLFGVRARAAAALKHVAGTGRRTRRGSGSGELGTLSRARRRCTQRRGRLWNPTVAASSQRLDCLATWAHPDRNTWARERWRGLVQQSLPAGLAERLRRDSAALAACVCPGC
jgi:hypothetical protein